MKMTELFSLQLEREAAVSRRVLERVPDGRPEWKPHEKSILRLNDVPVPSIYGPSADEPGFP